MNGRLHRLPPAAALAVLILLSPPSSAAAAAVKVVRKPAEVKYHAFDPQNRPADMPPLKPGEAAICVSEFGAAAELRYTQSTRRQAAGTYLSKLAVDDVRLELTLKIDVWLPATASDKLKAHEEGHRRIAERVYDEVAPQAARAAAERVAGGRPRNPKAADPKAADPKADDPKADDPKPAGAARLEAEGATAKEAQAAVAAVLAEAQDAMIQAYLDQTSRAGQKVQEAYDEITAHGRRAEVAEADAIGQAWGRHTPPMWAPPGQGAATRPATRPAKR